MVILFFSFQSGIVYIAFFLTFTDPRVCNNLWFSKCFLHDLLSLTVFFIVLYVTTSVIAVTGNCLVMYVIIFRRLKTVTNMYIANLALADIIIGMFAIPFQFQAILLQRWTLPPFMCKVLVTFQPLNCRFPVDFSAPLEILKILCFVF